MFPLIVLLLCAAATTPAPAARPLRPEQLSEICAPEIERFCPTLSGTAQVRNQKICLRPYRSSLSRACRGALTAIR